MEDKELDQLLKNALSKDFELDDKLNTKILQKVRENEMKDVRKIRRFPIVAAICCALFCCTAFAAWKYLTPKDVAIEYGDKQLAAAFEGNDAILMDESKTYDEYTVKLLGAVSGQNLTNFCTDGQVVSERTYAVVAIAKTDGTPMPKTSDDDYGKDPFFISPLIQGLNPQQYNIMTMNGGYFDIVREGIMYRMIECDNIQIFADHALYLCVSNSTFYEGDAYQYNEKTGDISVNESYKGMNLLFDFPLNKDKGNKEAAQEYLKELSDAQEADAQEGSNEEEEAVQNVDINEIMNHWTLVSKEKVTPDQDERIYYSYKTSNGSGEGFITVDALFEKDEIGYSKNLSISESDTGQNTVIYYRDEKGDVTVSVYETVK
ncbi:hypothetical protein CLNEO_01990 [Anaerotignum neopropionicum]|uniref:DUF4179 domain-containing protein n=1 Tax=Anaerotignum neopropionicum TaxID=36847 RepID=A0A136WI34_9FIRM|nr:hypothetical protein [Anaerotignum neopropionicum]KXL54103.1 hypothetical protein CLNEO_01990 [Anaerotignum neopropionicum]